MSANETIRNTHRKVGLFVATGLILFGLAVVLLGGNQRIFSKKTPYTTYFSSVDGLISGAKVMLSGIQVGVVDIVEYDRKKGSVRVVAQVENQFSSLLTQGSSSEIATQGVLGDKFLVLKPGPMGQPELGSGAEIPSREGGGLTQFISDGEKLLFSLNSIAGSVDRLVTGFEKNQGQDIFRSIHSSAKNIEGITSTLQSKVAQTPLAEATMELQSILKKINQGKGTLGALVNDPGLYDEAKSLLGGMNRNRILRNVIRQSIQDDQKNQN